VSYKLIDHTADFGIHVFGKDEKRLFQNAALAMFELIVETGDARSGVQQRLSVEGADYPDLMVNWLRELLYMWAGGQKVLNAVAVDTLTSGSIAARVWAEPYDPARHSIIYEIKAVTYHQIDVAASNDHWEARIIFDV